MVAHPAEGEQFVGPGHSERYLDDVVPLKLESTEDFKGFSRFMCHHATAGAGGKTLPKSQISRLSIPRTRPARAFALQCCGFLPRTEINERQRGSDVQWIFPPLISGRIVAFWGEDGEP